MSFKMAMSYCSGLMCNRIFAALCACVVLLAGCGTGTPAGSAATQTVESVGSEPVPPPKNKELFLPEASNDTAFAVIGLPRQTDIEAYAVKHYPVGTKTIELVVSNHSPDTLRYSTWFDFRKLDGGEPVPLTPRQGTMENPDEVAASSLLAAGETVTLNLPIDLFDPPLGVGNYRAAQLACFENTHGEALACTEITADFVLF